MQTKHFRLIALRLAQVAVLFFLLNLSTDAQSQPVSKILPGRNFDGSSWSAFTGSWSGFFPYANGGSPVSRRGLPPTIVNAGGGYARFPLHRFDPNNPGLYSVGSEIRTNYRWTLSSSDPTLEFIATVRIPAITPYDNNDTPNGVVMGFFVYNDKGFLDNQSYGVDNNEIDFEMPRHLLPNTMWLNLYRNSDHLDDGVELSNAEDSEQYAGMKLPTPISYGQWFSLKIQWKKNSVVWSIGDGNRQNFVVVRDIKRPGNDDPLPVSTNPVGVQLNIWAPPQGWFSGSPSLIPRRTDNADDSRPIYFDVKEVRVAAHKVKGVPKNQINQ